MHADIYACDGWNLKINWVGSFDLRVNKSLCKGVFFFGESGKWMDEVGLLDFLLFYFNMNSEAFGLVRRIIEMRICYVMA